MSKNVGFLTFLWNVCLLQKRPITLRSLLIVATLSHPISDRDSHYLDISDMSDIFMEFVHN